MSLRRCLRVGERFGQPVEDLGVIPDISYKLTRRDLIEANADLMDKAGELLAQGTPRRLEAAVASQTSSTMTLSVTTEAVTSLDVYVRDRPATTSRVQDGVNQVQLPKPPAGSSLRLDGFAAARSSRRAGSSWPEERLRRGRSSHKSVGVCSDPAAMPRARGTWTSQVGALPDGRFRSRTRAPFRLVFVRHCARSRARVEHASHASRSEAPDAGGTGRRHAEVGRARAAERRYAAQGAQLRDGLRAWSRLAGAELVLEDDESRPEHAVDRYRTLLDRCGLVLGPYGSDSVRAVARAGFAAPLWNHGGAADDVQRLPGIVSIPSPARPVPRCSRACGRVAAAWERRRRCERPGPVRAVGAGGIRP